MPTVVGPAYCVTGSGLTPDELPVIFSTGIVPGSAVAVRLVDGPLVDLVLLVEGLAGDGEGVGPLA